MTETVSDSEWEHAFPYIAWRTPMPVQGVNGKRGFGCRFCILRYGLNASTIRNAPQTLEAFLEHIQEHHPKK